MPLIIAALATEIEDEIKARVPAASRTADADIAVFATAVATAVVNHLQTNATPIVGGVAGTLT